jgi:SAM-dependent methyltransferase
MDADDWRVENPEAEAAVRFTLECTGEVAAAAAAAQKDASERRDRERAGAFEDIYQNFGWEPSADSTKETRSGPGSYLARTNASRAFLADVLQRYEVRSMLDAGCGDVNWQGHTRGINEIEYFGIDIVPQMIADNTRRLGGPGRRMSFAVKDVVKDDLGGPYDLVLCRDTLFHLPLWDAGGNSQNSHFYKPQLDYELAMLTLTKFYQSGHCGIFSQLARNIFCLTTTRISTRTGLTSWSDYYYIMIL